MIFPSFYPLILLSFPLWRFFVVCSYCFVLFKIFSLPFPSLPFQFPSHSNVFFFCPETSEWILRGAHIIQTTPPQNFPSNETRSGVLYMIHIERQVFYYFFYLVSPCMLVSFITLVLFLLPPDCGELMVVGVTLLLSLTVFFLLASTHIPETSEVVPLIGR